MVRVTKTGISALVLPDGEIAARTSIGRREILRVSVSLAPPTWTLMRAWGDWFGAFSALASLLLTLAALLTRPGLAG